MCGVGGNGVIDPVTKEYISKDELAKRNTEREARKKSNLAQGESVIDQQFAGFNDDFYNKYKQDYQDTYNPQLLDQYNNTSVNLRDSLKENNLYNSNFAIDQLTGLKGIYDTEKARVEGSNGELGDLAGSYRDTINAEEGNLREYNQNTQTIFDPIDISGKVSGKADEFRNYKFDTPLADTFGSFYNASKSKMKGYTPTLGVQNYGSISSSGGTGNRVIN